MPLSRTKFSSLQRKTKKKRQQIRTENEKLKGKLAELAAVEKAIIAEQEKGNAASSGTLTSLARKKDRLSSQTADLRAKISNFELEIGGIIDEIIFSTDPRDQVAMLDDSYPVFLAPVRVETRFVTVKHIARVQRDQLPATSLGTPVISVVDGRPVVNATTYGVSEVINGVNEVPVIDDAEELWIRIFPDDIAVHTHEEELTETEIKAAQTFWKHIWKAAGDESLRIGAWRGLVSGRGPERAAWIARQMAPTNPDDRPTTVVEEPDDLPVEPTFPSPSTRASTWSRAPHTRIMPDRFVVRLYQSGAFREVVGNVIPDPLHLGVDPMATEMEVESIDGRIDLKDKIKWLQDFDEAERVGMGIRVPLFPLEVIAGFDKVLVLGVKTSADEEEGKELLEELLDNHHYTHGGLSVIPQGTPTNNTEEADSGYTAYNANEESLFDLEMGDARFNPTTVDKNKTDGQHLADALGISYDTVQHLMHADQTDTREGMCMNRALWPVTFGYYLPQMMHPVFSDADIERTKDHFCKYVLGRGRIPSIRVDDQPYGILPVTAFSKWKYNSNSTNDRFLGKMHKKILKNLENSWQILAAKVNTATNKANQGNVERLFLDVIGLHASSVEFYQRYVTGPYLLWNLYNYSNVISTTIVNPTNASYANSLDFFQLFGDQNFLYVFPPRLFDFFYGQDHKHLNGPVIDPVGLGEDKFLSALGANDENYIDWLLKSNWTQIKKEDFSTIGGERVKPPTSLLYLMLRHSALLEYTRSAYSILTDKGLATELDYLDLEFYNVAAANGVNFEARDMVRSSVAFRESIRASRRLDRAVDDEFTRRADSGELEGMDFDAVTAARAALRTEMDATERASIIARAEAEANDIIAARSAPFRNADIMLEPQPFLDGLTITDYVWNDLQGPKGQSEFKNMHELQENLECLKSLSTAKLERCFAEHVDTANYRLDAWFYSLVLERLDKLRKSGNNRQEGVYLGSYAWLENLRKGSFDAIHYREVDIRPERILVPEIANVHIASHLNTDLTISGVKSFAFATERSSTNQPAAPIITNDSTPFTFGVTMFMMHAGTAGTAAAEGNQGYIPSGGNTLEIDATLTQVNVGSPRLMDTPALRMNYPSYIYLGRAPSGVQDITYDQITDQFINRPRVDDSNQGYIHAPSINHATTAAVLRAGYETHKLNTGSNDDALAININSKRVRKALFYLEGVNNGQELGALLGYQFERGLHDKDIGLDEYILEMRLKYPFVSGRVTDNTGVTSIDTAEAYNVVNGLELLENSEDPVSDYPYGISGLPTSGNRKAAIIEEVDKLHDAMDGINDLLMAESMHQVVLGNFDKASAMLRAMGGDPLAIDPDVIKTPRNFDILNHRVGCHFDLSPNGHKIWTTDGTPRSIAEPHLNRWLSTVLPASNRIQINYQFQSFLPDGSPDTVTTDRLGINELGIEPIDLFYLLNLNSEEGGAAAMVNLINYHVRKEVAAADNVEVSVAFADKSGLGSDQLCLLEVQGLIDQLHKVVSESRPLRPIDYLLSSTADTTIEANPNLGFDSQNLAARLTDAFGATMSNGQRGLQGILQDLEAGITTAETITDDPASIGPNKLEGLRTALFQSAFFGIQNAFPATAVEVSLEYSTALLEVARAALKDLNQRKTQAENLFNQVAATSDENRKVRLLEEVAKAIYGRPFKVFPEYRLYNQGQVQAARDYSDYLDFAGPNAVHDWLQGLSPVRKRIRAYHQSGLLAKALASNDGMLDLQLSQIPLSPVDDANQPTVRWLGVEFPEDYEMPDENISMLFFNPPGNTSSGLQAGILIDEWVEEIPHKMAHTGLSVHFNNPNSEPPQTCLLAVSPDLDGKWSWDDLMDTLVETLDWAKKRAVDPDLLNESIYPQVLPAVYAAISASDDDTPTLDFGRNVIKNPKPGVFGLINVLNYAGPYLTTTLNTENL